MGEDRAVNNLTKCEYFIVSRNFYGLWNIAEGKSDYADWNLDELGFAILLGLTPPIESILGFYERVWGRWNGDRLIATGDYTREEGRVNGMCLDWRPISNLVDLAVAEFYLHLARITDDEEKRRAYRGIALYKLKMTLNSAFTVADPQRIRKEVAEITAETGSLSLALDIAYGRMDENWKYCKHVEEYEKPHAYNLGYGCWYPIADEQLEMLDETRVFETDLLADYTAVPSDIVTAWSGFWRMAEECPDAAEC